MNCTRRNGRIVAKGTARLCALRSNPIWPACLRRSYGSVKRWQRSYALPLTSHRSRTIIQGPIWAARRYASSAEPTPILPSNDVPADFRNTYESSAQEGVGNDDSTEGVENENESVGKGIQKKQGPCHLELSKELLSTMVNAVGAVLPHAGTTPYIDRRRTTRSRSFSYASSRNLGDVEARNRQLLKQHEKNKGSQDPQFKHIRAIRESLPMSQFRSEILNLVKENEFSIVIGDTGSGKSTQVPQIILEDAIERGEGASVRILCTQPRRIAATSLARRVAAERNEVIGDSVGYFVRFEKQAPKQVRGSVQFCTVGWLLVMLQHNEGFLDDVSHIILDEVHERSVDIDVLMLILKRRWQERFIKAKKKGIKDPCSNLNFPRVVLMSATLDKELFADYFATHPQLGLEKRPSSRQDTNLKRCPWIEVPGRAFPVTHLYLDEIVPELEKKYSKPQLKPLTYKDDKRFILTQLGSKKDDKLPPAEPPHAQPEPAIGEDDAHVESVIPFGLIATTVAHIVNTSEAGAILVFLPGWYEIQIVEKTLKDKNFTPLGVDFNDVAKFKIHLVHSAYNSTNEDLFSPTPPGCRKIILATNIAETSITIPEVRYVVDSGKHRRAIYNHVDDTNVLQCTWINNSSSKQRAGRAGRVQDGHYYALFSKTRSKILPNPLPQIRSVDLMSTCLSVAAGVAHARLSIKDALAESIEPPCPSAVDTAIRKLIDIGALTKDEQVTPLGSLLETLPMHPIIGRICILGIIFKCLDPLLLISAANDSIKPLFVRPLDEASQQAAKKAHLQFRHGYNSDPIALVIAFNMARRCWQSDNSRYEAFMHENFLDKGAFLEINRSIKQTKEKLASCGLLDPHQMNGDTHGKFIYDDLDENSENFSLIRALSVTGYRGSIAHRERQSLYKIRNGEYADIHASSVNRNTGPKTGDMIMPQSAIMSYGEVLKVDNNVFGLHKTTLISPVTAALFAAELDVEENGTILVVDKWLRLTVNGGPGLPSPSNISTIILLFREAWNKILSTAFENLQEGHLARYSRERKEFVDALLDVVSRDMGDMDLSRLLDDVAFAAAAKGISKSDDDGSSRVHLIEGNLRSRTPSEARADEEFLLRQQRRQRQQEYEEKRGEEVNRLQAYMGRAYASASGKNQQQLEQT